MFFFIVFFQCIWLWPVDVEQMLPLRYFLQLECQEMDMHIVKYPRVFHWLGLQQLPNAARWKSQYRTFPGIFNPQRPKWFDFCHNLHDCSYNIYTLNQTRWCPDTDDIWSHADTHLGMVLHCPIQEHLRCCQLRKLLNRLINPERSSEQPVGFENQSHISHKS